MVDRDVPVRRIRVALALSCFLLGCSSDGNDAPPDTGNAVDGASGDVSSETADARTDAPADDPLEAKRLGCEFHGGARASDTLTGYPSPSPLKHIVILVQENRSFDHVLGRHPRVAKGELDGFPDDYENVAVGGATYKPERTDTSCIGPDILHSWKGMHAAWNNGKNDGFYVQATSEGPGRRALLYNAPEDLPFYTWLYGDAFATSDRFFASVLGPTAPNRSYLYAASSFGAKDGVGARTTSLFDSLETAAIDWRVYEGAMYPGSQPDPPAPRLRTLVQLTADLASGDLGQVAFVNGEFSNSEHPPLDINAGETFVHDFVVAYMASPAWSTSALFVTYDESGGFFDHVPPPPACPPDAEPANAEFDRYGFRLPFVLVSAYARNGYVSHRVHSHTSITRFVEAAFDLGALSDRDANSDALLDLFDFAAPPAAPPDPSTVPAALPPTCPPPP